MTGAVAAAAAVSRKPITASGSFVASGAGPVQTSATITLTVPGPSPRNLNFNTYVDVGVITSTQYRLNAGAFTNITDGTDLSVSNNDTLAIRTNGCTAEESRAVTLLDQYSGRVVETFSHTGV